LLAALPRTRLSRKIIKNWSELEPAAAFERNTSRQKIPKRKRHGITTSGCFTKRRAVLETIFKKEAMDIIPLDRFKKN